MTDCPTHDQLAQYAEGQASGPEAATMARHLNDCIACRFIVDQMHRDNELATRLQAVVEPGDDPSLLTRLRQQLAEDYEVQEMLGRGADGIVFRARDVRLNRLVAIKCLTPDRHGRRLAEIFQEARNLAKINHPNVAAIYRLDDEGEIPIIVMEHVDGLPVDKAVVDQDVRSQVEVFRQVLRAVAELHRRGIVHRDLKPGNILVDRQGVVKVLDFGIAQPFPAEDTIELPVPPQGTPAYLSPEQSRGSPVKPSSDVFSLGVVLFEMLTGQRPFVGGTIAETIRAIRQADPPLPRELRPEIPGPLQAICLMALEKDPRRRYPSARHFLLDLERFISGEAVVANPALLKDILEHAIDRHVEDLSQWHMDRLISTREYDSFQDRYERLRQREEFWVLDSRRISFSQVLLHLGAWSCVVAAFLMLCFHWPHLPSWARPLLPWTVFGVLQAMGTALWHRRTRRVGIVLVMAATLALPIAIAATLIWLEWPPRLGLADDLWAGFLTNEQLLIAAAGGFLWSLMLWRVTRTSAFSLIWGLAAIVTATAVFTFLGLRKQWGEGHIDTVAGWYLAPGAILLALAMALDLRWRQVHFAGPLYVMSVIVLVLSMTAIAYFGPTTQWLGLVHLEGEPALHRHIKYSFMANGVVYLLAGLLGDRSSRSRWLRRIATVMFWLAPSHVLVPILTLENEWAVLPAGWTVPEIILPLAAIAFVFAAVPKQMKSFFFSGLFYVAVSVQRLTARHFEDKLAWPIALTVAGLMLVMVAWRRPRLFDQWVSNGERGKAEARAPAKRLGHGEPPEGAKWSPRPDQD